MGSLLLLLQCGGCRGRMALLYLFVRFPDNANEEEDNCASDAYIGFICDDLWVGAC